MTSKNFNRGFSAVEVVITVAISAVVVLSIFQIYITFSKSYAFQNASINGSISAASFVNELNDTALQADAIVSSQTISGTSYTTGSTTAVFELPSINSSGDIISNTYDYVVFYSSSTEAYRVLDANASSARIDGKKRLTDVLQNLTFTYDSGTPSLATSVTVDITNQSVVKQATTTTRLKQQVYLRNK